MSDFVQGLSDRGDGFFGGEPLRSAVQRRATELIAECERGSAAGEEALPVEAAVACGYCRLFAGVPPTTPFPDWLSVPAAERVATLLEASIDDANSLPGRWDAATGEEGDALVCELLEVRMDAWAALETLLAVPESSELSAAIGACEDQLGRFDRALAERVEFLATLATTQLLANWRLSVADRFRYPLPWWLDGTLEEVAVTVERSIAAREETLFGHRRAMPTSLDTAAIRARIEQPFALAANVPGAAPTLAPLLRWRSPDGAYAARLLSHPGGPQAGPHRLVLEIVPEGEQADLALLRGAVVVLGGRGVPIGWRSVDGEEVAVAEFPADFVLAALQSDGGSPGLVVMPDGGVWDSDPVRPGR